MIYKKRKESAFYSRERVVIANPHISREIIDV